jgi:hypothetical protein
VWDVNYNSAVGIKRRAQSFTWRFISTSSIVE